MIKAGETGAGLWYLSNSDYFKYFCPTGDFSHLEVALANFQGALQYLQQNEVSCPLC